MRYIFFIALISIASSCMHSRTGSGNIITEKRTAGNFREVRASGGVTVHLKTGPETAITVEADDNIIHYVETTVSGGTLTIRIRELNSLSNVTLNVYVTAPTLSKISASAGADIDSKDMIASTEKVSVHASSGGSIHVNLDAPSVSLNGSSGAEIMATGRTRDLTADASSAAAIHAFGLHAENVTAGASSSGEIAVFGSVSINASASSAGSVNYKGGAPSVKKNESSGGSVEARN